ADGTLRAVVKPSTSSRSVESGGTVREYVGADTALREVGLDPLADRRLSELSGGELQLTAIARALATPADFYLFDEPSSYLDIVRRLEVARHLRRLGERAGVLVIEHDLALLDYLADQAHLIYGTASAFGVVSHPLPMRSAVNTYLGGYLKDENVRFRTEPVRFVAHPPKPPTAGTVAFEFPALVRVYPHFRVGVGP
ncbi:ATPase RIL, partial [mine drainage metagenome]